MKLRKANERTLRRQIFGFALRSSFAVAAVASAAPGLAAGQSGSALVLPALPTAVSNDACGQECAATQERHGRLVRLLGIRGKQADAVTKQSTGTAPGIPALPAMPNASNLPAVPPFPDFSSGQPGTPEQTAIVLPALPPAEPTKPAEANGVAQIAWHPSQPAKHSTHPVVAAAATETITSQVTDAGIDAIALPASSDQPEDESFDTIEIPMSLPLEPAQNGLSNPVRAKVIQPPAATAPSTEMPAAEPTSVSSATIKPHSRAPQIVASRPTMQLSGSSPTAGSGTEFSLSDSSVDTRVSSRKSDTFGLQKPAADSQNLTAAQTKPRKPSSPALRPIGDATLPSTSSSRGQTVQSAPMRVKVEGEGIAKVGQKPISLGASPLPPKPTFDMADASPQSLPDLRGTLPATKMPSGSVEPKRFMMRDAASVPASKVGKPIPARLASSGLTITDDSTKVSSRRSTEAKLSTASPKYDVVSRIKVRAEQSNVIPVREAILQTSVEDPSICRLIQSGDTGLSVVGLKAGTTRFAVVTASNFGEPKVEVHEVSVGHGHKARIGLTELAAGIDETINRLYPRSDIRIAAGDGGLIVDGKADSESEAKRVLGLVRRTSLLPVVDRLDVR